MRTQKIPSQQHPFKNLDEIVRATGRSWRTVRKRLEEARCYPLPLDIDRGDVLILFDDTPAPVYTEAELDHQRNICDVLLREALALEAQERCARSASQKKGTAS